MTVTNGELQVLWSATQTATIASAGGISSDEALFDANIFSATVQFKANAVNAGDSISFYVALAAETTPDGAGAREFDTTKTHLVTIDCAAAATDYLMSANLPISFACKIYAEDSTGTNAGNVTVSATITEFKSA